MDSFDYNDNKSEQNKDDESFSCNARSQTSIEASSPCAPLMLKINDMITPTQLHTFGQNDTSSSSLMTPRTVRESYKKIRSRIYGHRSDGVPSDCKNDKMVRAKKLLLIIIIWTHDLHMLP